jgi:tRNA (guanine-N7-)-methyltransferase
MAYSPPSFLSSFGRNRGRALRPYQQSLVDDVLPTLSPRYAPGEAGEAVMRDWVASLPFGQYRRIALEIGFGAGEHLLAQAAHHPDTLWIGCEPYINGVAKCLSGMAEKKLTNLRFCTYDARHLIAALPDGCLDSVFILFPDPWPKAKHNKRRLVSVDTFAMLARVHKPGGRLLLATDHVDYSVWMLEHLAATPHYEWRAQCRIDWETPPADWTQTKYQRKTTAEGRPPLFFECVRA